MEKKIDYYGKMKSYKRLIMGLGVLLGITGILILYLSWPLITGKTVVLATRPIDPFEILRGQYFSINYDISSIPFIKDAAIGDNVYVSLREDADHIWRLQEASLTIPSRNKTFIKGKIQSINSNQMWIEYGIEQYFFERNAQLPTTNITVEAKISQLGQARISQLLHNGKPVDIKYQKVTLTS